MNLQNRIAILTELGQYLRNNGSDWNDAKKKAEAVNHWFTQEFIDIATENIASAFLQKERLVNFAKHYHLDDAISPLNIGIVMAGNIPMVGFHDWLCVFLCGHHATIKFSSKDNVLLPHIIGHLTTSYPELNDCITIRERLKDCDAYIATGNNNSAAVFETYFGKYPSIIRKNRTSIAILDGTEPMEALDALANDVHCYFGLGCRNVTKIMVPEGYDFIPLINAFDKFAHFRDHHAYANNYDYQLSLMLLNNIPYMSSKATLIVENKSLFSPISVLHYETYKKEEAPLSLITNHDTIQAIIGTHGTPFGEAQKPTLETYADGVDTMQFLLGL
jgi:hypothetical protein